MVPYNFEDDFKEKLENRIITPSENSWKKLGDRLDKQGNSKDSRIIWWLSIAASIVGVMLVTLFYFNKVESLGVEPEMVETPLQESKKEKVVMSNTQELVNNNTENQEELESVVKKADVSETNQIIISKSVIDQKVSKNNQIALTSNFKEKKGFQAKEIKSDLSTNIIEKEEIKIVQNTFSEIDKKTNLELEINRLLDRAHKEAEHKKNNKENVVTVNSNDLLEEVEFDLEESFREKVFKSVISGYNSVKTAVAERNK